MISVHRRPCGLLSMAQLCAWTMSVHGTVPYNCTVAIRQQLYVFIYSIVCTVIAWTTPRLGVLADVSIDSSSSSGGM